MIMPSMTVCGLKRRISRSLAGAGFAFVGVADEVLLAREGAGHEAPLQTRGEAGTATTAQRRSLDLGDDLILGHAFAAVLAQDLAQRGVTATRLVVLQAPVAAVNASVDLRFDVAAVENGFLAGRLEFGKVKHLVSPSLGLSLERVDQLVELVVAHVADHLAVVHQGHGRIGARAQALAVLTR
jgi:hypothetical protein